MDNQKAAQALKLQGNEAFKIGEYKKACKIYRDALKLDLNSVILSNRAMCFIKMQDFERAIRDCEEGIKLNPELSTHVKLQYRLGVAAREYGYLRKAISAFETCLQLDPKNSTCEKALQDLSSSIELKVENVDKLPSYYESLIQVEKSDTDQASKTSNVNNSEVSSKAIKEIDELFKSKKTNSYQVNSQVKVSKPQVFEDNTDNNFNSRPSMNYLCSLKSLPIESKTKAYKYVINIDPLIYQDLFHRSGVEVEFLEFFFEAANSIADLDEILDWEIKVSNILKVLSNCPRYSLALSFCSEKSIKDLLSKVKSSDVFKPLIQL